MLRWLADYFLFVALALKEAFNRSRGYKLVKKFYLLFWLIFSGVFGYGLYKIFEVLSNYLALPWLIVIALCIFILFLLFTIEAMRLVHDQVLDEWTRHMSIVDGLYD